MHFLFTLNEKYSRHLAATIVSILESQNPNTELSFHIISSDISKSSKEKIEQLKKIRVFSIKYYNPAQLNINWSVFPLHMEHISIETYYRLFAHEILDLEKVIHLDVDLLVLSDLHQLWNAPIGNKLITGTRCPAFHIERLKPAGFYFKKHTYFTCGANLLNLKEWRKRNISKEIINITKQHFSLLKLQDADILNILCKDALHEMPLSYNAVTSIFEDKPVIDRLIANSPKEYEKAVKTPHIIHFCRPIKAWHSNCTNPYSLQYWKCLNKTPWHTDYGQSIKLIKWSLTWQRLKKIFKSLLKRLS